MVGRLKQLWSRYAIWSRRLALLALPALAMAALGHRFGLMSTPSFLSVFGVTSTLAFLALVLGIIGLIQVWQEDRLGLGDAIAGALLALLTLSPSIASVPRIIMRAPLHEISTDLTDPPIFEHAAEVRTPDMNPIGPPDADAIRLQREAYPEIGSRRYAAGSDRLFEIAERVARDFGWRIRDELAPDFEGQTGRLEAEATTPIFGFVDDIVVRILPDPLGSRLDVRSSSRYGRHDLGTNADRVRAYLAAIDRAIASGDFGDFDQ